MAITRTAFTDDDGSGTSGTVINNAVKTELYNQIDAALAAVASLAGANVFTASVGVVIKPAIGSGLTVFNGAGNDYTILSFETATGLSLGQTTFIGGGVVIGSPTGGFKGAGTINVAAGLYVNGVAVTVP